MGRSYTFKAARIAAFSAGMALASIAPSLSRADNLADAMIGAYNTSGLLEQNRALLRAADEDVAVAVSTLRPVIDWAASISREQRQSFPANTNAFLGLTAEWLLFDSGGRRYAVKSTKETVLATRQTLVSIEQQILLRAVTAYFSVVFEQQNVTLRENNVGLLGEELRAAQDRFEVGEVTRTDVALAESSQAAARSSLAAARGQLANARAEYLVAVGHKPNDLVEQPKLPVAPATADATVAVAMRNHPDILSAQRQVAAAELNILGAQSEMGPAVSLNGNAGVARDWNDSEYSDNFSISLNLGQPIYQGGRLTALVRRSMATRDSVRANLLTVQDNVALSATNAFVRSQVARASLEASVEQISAAQVAFDGLREEAKLGARTTIDVLVAEQELLNARTLQISARAEEAIAAFQLLAAQGLLTVEHLGLAVQVYDPSLYYNLVKDAPSRLSKQSRELDRVLKALNKE